MGALLSIASSRLDIGKGLRYHKNGEIMMNPLSTEWVYSLLI